MFAMKTNCNSSIVVPSYKSISLVREDAVMKLAKTFQDMSILLRITHISIVCFQAMFNHCVITLFLLLSACVYAQINRR